MVITVDRKLANWIKTKSPKFDKKSGRWYFQEAYADAKDEEHVLPSYVYNFVKSYNTDSSALRTYYFSYFCAMKRLNIWIRKYENLLNKLQIETR